jgi:two-component system sensor kinase FixL
VNANLRQPLGVVANQANGDADWALAALERHPVAHTLLDDDGRVRWMNAAARLLLGAAAQDAVGKPLEIVSPCYAGEIERAPLLLPASITRPRPDGRVTHFAIQLTVVDTNRHLLVEQDVTDFVRGPGGEQDRLRRIRDIIDGSPDCIVAVDAAAVILAYSPSLQDLLGYEPDNLLQRNVFEFVHPDDMQEVRERVASGGHVHRPQRFRDVVARMRHADGSWRWVAAVMVNSLTVPSIEAVMVYLRDATHQVELEIILQKRERRFAALTQNSDDMILVLGAEGHLSFESASVHRILGYPQSKLTGASLIRRIHRRHRRRALQLLRDVTRHQGSGRSVECMIRSQDGEYRWIEAVCVDLLADPDVAGVLITARDISARKSAEQERDTALDSGGIALWEYDLGQRRTRWIGAGLPELFCTRDGNYHHDDYIACMHPDDIDRVEKSYSLVASGQSNEAQVEFRTRDVHGQWRWIIERGRRAGFNPLTGAPRLAGVCIDITGQRATEQELATARQQLQFAMGSADFACYELDVVADTASGLNDWCLSHGLPPESAGGHDRRWESYLHPDDLAEANRRYHAHLRGDTAYADLEYRIRVADGRYLWMMDRAQVVQRDATGRPLRVLGLLINIEDRKRVENALRDSEARLSTAIWGGSFGLWEMDVASQKARWFSDWCEREDLDPCDDGEHVATWDANIHAEDIGPAARAFTRMTNNECDFFESEYRVRTRSGTWKWIFERSRALERDASGRPSVVAGICFNVDNRKQAEDALRKSEALYRNVANLTRGFIAECEILDGSLRVVWASEGFAAVFGEPFVNNRTATAWHRKFFDAETLTSLRHGALELAQGRRIDIETTARRTDGQRVWLRLIAQPMPDSTGLVSSAIGVAYDITEQRQKEQLLRLQARVLETIREGVVLLDARNTVKLSNPAFDRMCGANQSGLLGERIESLLLIAPSALHNETGVLECDARRLDGSLFAAAAAITPMLVDNEPHRLLVINDVSDRKLLEREILEVSSHEQQRIGNDLHDGLGQELTGVALMLRALSARVDREFPQGRQEIDEIVQLVNHSIDSTRALARGLSPVSIERGGLLPALETLALRARSAFGITILLRRLVRRPLRLDADAATHLYRIVQEALTNAVRHGRATRVSITLISENDYIEMSVRDNGRGFAQSGGSRGGIGLKTMNYRTQMLRGELSIKPVSAGGTVVRCRCPQRRRTGAPPTPARRSRVQVTRILPGS